MNEEKPKVRKGQWFAVPLRCGGYAVGLVARGNARTHCKLGYFFGPRYTAMPGDKDTLEKTADDAVLIGWFGDGGIIERRWPLLDTSRPWDPRQWPIPIFGRTDATGSVAWTVEYAEGDVLRRLRETRSTIDEISKLPEDGVWGDEAVASHLSRILCPDRTGSKPKYEGTHLRFSTN